MSSKFFSGTNSEGVTEPRSHKVMTPENSLNVFGILTPDQICQNKHAAQGKLRLGPSLVFLENTNHGQQPTG
jgi:hypothetical protein